MGILPRRTAILVYFSSLQRYSANRLRVHLASLLPSGPCGEVSCSLDAARGGNIWGEEEVEGLRCLLASPSPHWPRAATGILPPPDLTGRLPSCPPSRSRANTPPSRPPSSSAPGYPAHRRRLPSELEVASPAQELTQGAEVAARVASRSSSASSSLRRARVKVNTPLHRRSRSNVEQGQPPPRRLPPAARTTRRRSGGGCGSTSIWRGRRSSMAQRGLDLEGVL
jgi:hypothetical protein